MASRCRFVLSAINGRAVLCARAMWRERRRGVVERAAGTRTTLTRSGGELTGLHSRRNEATTGPPRWVSRRFKRAPTQGPLPSD